MSPRFLLGLSTGVFVGAALSVLLLVGPTDLRASMPGNATPKAPLTQCAAQVDTTEWETFRSERLGWELQYPPDYTLREEGNSIILEATEQPLAAIVIEKTHSTLRNMLDPSMEQAGWKIADRNTYALATPYFSESPEWLTATYLFIRDFPLRGETATYSMANATIALPRSAPEFQNAREQGITNLSNIMTEPEKILSTFRFLRYEELENE